MRLTILSSWIAIAGNRGSNFIRPRRLIPSLLAAALVGVVGATTVAVGAASADVRNFMNITQISIPHGRGKHTFSVRGIGTSGNVDPTPAKHKWK